jgi:hypothetical protein
MVNLKVQEVETNEARLGEKMPKMSKVIDYDQELKDLIEKFLYEPLRLRCIPLDFEQLQVDGYIVKEKGKWWRVLKNLPEHVWEQIIDHYEFTETKEINGKKYSETKFITKFPTSWDKLQRKYHSLTGKNYNE